MFLNIDLLEKLERISQFPICEYSDSFIWNFPILTLYREKLLMSHITKPVIAEMEKVQQPLKQTNTDS